MDERSLLLVSGLLLGVLIATLVALLLGQRRLALRQRELQASLDARIARLDSKLGEYQQSNIRMGEELLALRERLAQLDNKQQRLEQQDVQSLPYNQASRLVSMGASLDDLMQACGLSRSEAELMLKLHGNKP